MRLIPLLFWFLLSCAGHQYVVKVPEKPPIPPNTQGVLTLIGYWNQGQACPVDGVVYSARHMLEKWFGPNPMMMYFMWEDGAGAEGYAKATYVDMYQDIGLLRTGGDVQPTIYYPEGARPKSGDPVWWVQFQEGAKNAFLTEVKKGKVLHNRAGYTVFEPAPNPGASGSCLLNSRGEAIGVVVWRISDDGTSGSAVLLAEQ